MEVVQVVKKHSVDGFEQAVEFSAASSAGDTAVSRSERMELRQLREPASSDHSSTFHGRNSTPSFAAPCQLESVAVPCARRAFRRGFSQETPHHCEHCLVRRSRSSFELCPSKRAPDHPVEHVCRVSERRELPELARRAEREPLVIARHSTHSP